MSTTKVDDRITIKIDMTLPQVRRMAALFLRFGWGFYVQNGLKPNDTPDVEHRTLSESLEPYYTGTGAAEVQRMLVKFCETTFPTLTEKTPE